jgi:hypothetical protein
MNGGEIFPVFEVVSLHQQSVLFRVTDDDQSDDKGNNKASDQ